MKTKKLFAASVIVTAIFFAAATGCVAEESKTFENLKTGSPAPDFSLKSANGKTVSPKDYKGKKNILIAFFPKAGTFG